MKKWITSKTIIYLFVLTTSFRLYAEKVTFSATTASYSETDNIEVAVEEEKGSDYRVADWDDFKKYSDNLGDILDDLGIKDGDVVLITKGGRRIHSGKRYFIFVRGTPHSGAAVFDKYGNEAWLGSWYGYKNVKILAVKKNQIENKKSIFAVTSASYSETDNIGVAVEEEKGNDYRVADWDDFKKYSDNLGDILDDLGIKDGEVVLITKGGRRIHSGKRYFIFVRGTPHNGAAVFDKYSNDAWLGSWYGYKNVKILAVKKSQGN